MQLSPTTSPVAATPQAEGAERWRASLTLEFAAVEGRTFLAQRRHRGPLLVQRPFQQPDGSCHVYVIHPPSGIVGGDELSLELGAQRGARVVVTTPGATKFYRSSGPEARVVQRLELAEASGVEWFPQETIVYDGARSAAATSVHLEHSAWFAGWEVVCLGERAQPGAFMRGRHRQRFELWRQGRRLWVESSTLAAGDAALHAAWGLGKRRVLGSFVCAPPPRVTSSELLELVRRQPEAAAGDWFGATDLGAVLLCRYLGGSAFRCKEIFCSVWEAVRPLAIGQAARRPRIWAT